MDWWMDGWVDVKAGLRIAYSNQKACCKPFRSQWYTSKHAEIRTFCVCPKNPECPKPECAEIRTGLRSDFGTV